MKEMRVMQFPLKILTVVGCWPPVSWSSLCKRILYNVYTIFISLLLLSFILPQLMEMILNVNSTDEFSECLYTTLPTIVACCKMFNMLMNRRNIEILINALIEKPFRPLEPDEMEIRKKYDKIIQTSAIWYAILGELSVILQNLGSLFMDFPRGDLAYREWYEYSSDIMYYVIYFRQLISLTTVCTMNIACDCLFCGLLLNINCQIEILECRLRKCLRDQGNIGECVRLHDHIYKFAYMINEKFRIIIGLQFIVSTLIVCFNMFQMAAITLNGESIPLIGYTCIMIFQIFVYCWYGNEVKLKSMQLFEEVFGMNWTKADKKVKENLMIIMNRSLIPIEFSSAHIVTMNLDSFVKLLKTSYSAYSVLQHT